MICYVYGMFVAMCIVCLLLRIVYTCCYVYGIFVAMYMV